MAIVVEGKTSHCHFPYHSSVENNEARCQQILECRRQIKSWQDKLNRLLVVQERYTKLGQLQCDGADIHITWSNLSFSEKRDKDFILVALQSKKQHLPLELKSFDENVFPLHIRTDPDIYMARVRHESFEKVFRNYEGLVVPSPLCYDKTIMLEVVQRQPLAVKSMPDHWRDDQDILRAVLRHHELPSHMLHYFSNDIRSDAELMLEVFQHQDSQLSWMRDCSETLRGDKEFFINAVNDFRNQSNEDVGDRKIKLQIHNDKLENKVLRYASERLRMDFDVVMTCVRQCGMNLNHASADLRRNDRIVTAACAQNNEASRYCLPSMKDFLLEDKDYATSIISGVSSETLKLCLAKHGDDESFCLHSFSNINLEWSMIPEAFRSDANFVAKAAAGRLPWRLWGALPQEMKSNVQIASAIVKNEYVERGIVWGVIHNCPEVLSDRNLAMDLIANHFHFPQLFDWIIGHAVSDVQNDKALMLQAVKHQPRFWEYCSEELRGDRDILIAAAERSPESLRIVPGSYQLHHPDFVACAIQKHRKSFGCDHEKMITTMYKKIRREMWYNRQVAMAWLESGGRWMKLVFSSDFKKDGEMILTATKHFWNQFEYASDMLKSDKDFVLKALAVDARIIRFVSKKLLFDHDVMMAAFSKDVRAIQFYAEGGDHCFSFLVYFARSTRERLREGRTFQDVFIGSAKRAFPDNEDCNLPMLNQGPLMLATYGEKIASYAGILHDAKELVRHEAASKNLAAWGI